MRFGKRIIGLCAIVTLVGSVAERSYAQEEEESSHCAAGMHSLCVQEDSGHGCPSNAYAECLYWYQDYWACNQYISGGTSGACPSGSGACTYQINCQLGF